MRYVIFLLCRWFIQSIMKRQALGIARNRVDRLIAIKKDAQRKKNRFQMVGKEDDQDSNRMFGFMQWCRSRQPTLIRSATHNYSLKTRFSEQLISTGRRETTSARLQNIVLLSRSREEDRRARENAPQFPQGKREWEIRWKHLQTRRWGNQSKRSMT